MTLRKATITAQPVPGQQPSGLPYQPSWIDRLTDRVGRLPVPPWTFYLCLWLFLLLIPSAALWLDGAEPLGRLRWIYVSYAFYGVYFLAGIHYLDAWAKGALNSFRLTLEPDEEQQSLLFHQLTTMPARSIWLLSAAALASLVILFRPLIVPLWEAMGFFHPSTASTLIDLGIFAFNSLLLWAFIYHTLRQLRWVSKIHKAATRLDLFQLRPLYSLSGLTARTAGILLLVGYIIAQQSGSHGQFTTDPDALQISWLFMLVSMLVYSVLAVLVFFLPLLGLHQVLQREKERLQAEADSRLQALIQELHRRLDARQLEDADAVNKHMASLALEREILARLPTWPWKPGTLNLVITAVFLPILLWFVQQLLERLMGF